MFPLALLLTSPPALGCEAGYCVRGVVPADGAVDVPTDARVLVWFDTTPGSAPQVTVSPEGGEPLPVAPALWGSGQELNEVRVEAVAVAPELSPSTTYRVQLAGDELCGGVRETTFTTGDGPVGGPPEAHGVLTATLACALPPAERSSCDDQSVYPRWALTLDGRASGDAVAWEVRRSGVRIATVRALPATLQLLPEALAGEACFTAAAVGVGGAVEAEPAQVCVVPPAEGCALPETDPPIAPHTGGGPDTGAPRGDSDGPVPIDAPAPPSGCGCDGGAGVGGLTPLAWLGGLTRRRRRGWRRGDGVSACPRP